MARVPVVYEVPAQECPAGGGCPHSHPSSVPTLPCPTCGAEDYVPKGPDGKPVGNKTPSYYDAKREAQKHNGYVEYVDEKRGAEALRRKTVRLKWHRDKSDGLYAVGALGRYSIHRPERVKRSAGVYRWVITLGGSMLPKSFDEIAKAKAYAQRYDMKAPSVPQAPDLPAPYAMPRPPDLPGCAPFTTTTRDEAKFSACMALAQQIGPITTPTAVYKLLKDYCVRQDQEVFLVVSLDLHGHLRGIDEVAKGQRDRVSVGVADVIRAALDRGAKGFIVCHTHPSGKARPSQADRDLTRAIIKARAPFGSDCVFVDHIVLGLNEFASIKRRKLFRAR